MTELKFGAASSAPSLPLRRNIRCRLCRDLAAIGDAIRYADRPEAAAREEDAGHRRQSLADSGQPGEMADLVLGTLPRPSVQSHEHGIARDAKQLGELAPGRFDQFA